jgi:hypothetical protein
MLLLTHLVIALSSLIYTTYLYVRPSRAKVKVAYVLVAGTLASGTWLVVGTHAALLSSCISGLVYLGAVTVGLALSARKLAHETARPTSR